MKVFQPFTSLQLKKCSYFGSFCVHLFFNWPPIVSQNVGDGKKRNTWLKLELRSLRINEKCSKAFDLFLALLSLSHSTVHAVGFSPIPVRFKSFLAKTLSKFQLESLGEFELLKIYFLTDHLSSITTLMAKKNMYYCLYPPTERETVLNQLAQFISN